LIEYIIIIFTYSKMTEYINIDPIEKRAQQQRDASKRCYYKKIHENPEFYAAEKLRIKEYKINRYKNDPEYREKMKEVNRENQRKIREARKLQK
jgi:hypothetical protein